MRKYLTKRQAICLISSYLLGNTLAAVGGITKNEKYGYVTIGFSFLLFLGLSLMYKYILKKNSYESFFDIMENLFPKALSKVFLFVIFVYSFYLCMISCGNFVFFAVISTDSETNIFLLAVLVSICIYYIVSKNKKTLGRYCELIYPFIVTLFGIMIVFGIYKGNLDNLYISIPISVKTTIKSTLFNFLSSYADIFIIYLFMSNVFDKKNLVKTTVISAVVSTVVVMLVYFVNLIILGRNLITKLYYPTLFSFGVINPGLLAQRSETVYYISYIFFDIIYICVSLFVCINAFNRLFLKKTKLTKNKKRVLYALPSLILLVFMILFNPTGSFYDAYTGRGYLKLPVTLGIPALIFIVTLFNKSKLRKA